MLQTTRKPSWNSPYNVHKQPNHTSTLLQCVLFTLLVIWMSPRRRVLLFFDRKAFDSKDASPLDTYTVAYETTRSTPDWEVDSTEASRLRQTHCKWMLSSVPAVDKDYTVAHYFSFSLLVPFNFVSGPALGSQEWCVLDKGTNNNNTQN